MRKLTYKDVKYYIEKESNSGCFLLSKSYIKAKEKLLIQCKCGEIFNTSFNDFKHDNKQMCNKCSERIRARKRSLSYDQVKKYIEIESNSGCKLLSTEYINQRTELKILCSCGQAFKTSYNTFKSMNKRQCNDCGKEKLADSIKISFEDTKRIVEEKNPNVIVLEELKQNNKYYIRCKCKMDNYEWVTAKSHIINIGSGCPKCANNIKKTIKEIILELQKINPDIEILSKRYINNHEPLKCRCKIDNNIFYLCYSDLKSGHGCRECYLRNNRGENHPSWNPNLTGEERINGRNIEGYYDFIKSVYKRDSYTCQCCGTLGNGHNLNAHHLNGYNWDKEHRTDTNNGVTLCDSCHKEFHKIYGYGNNKKEQYEEYIYNKLNKIAI